MFCSGGISGKVSSHSDQAARTRTHTHTHTHTQPVRVCVPRYHGRRQEEGSCGRARAAGEQARVSAHVMQYQFITLFCDDRVSLKGERERLTWPRGSLMACVGDHYFRTVVITLDGAANVLLEVHGNCLSFSEVAIMCILAQSMHASFGKLVIINHSRLPAFPGAWLARPGRHTRHCAQSTTPRTFATCASLAGRNSPRSK
jgi:hypothetical protein